MQSFAHQLLAIQTPTLEPRPTPQAPGPTQHHVHHHPAGQPHPRSAAPLEAPRALAGGNQGHAHANANSHANGRDRSSTQHIPCKFFRAGQCQAGDKCSFSHAVEPAAPLYCKYYAKGHCKFGAKCALPHINDTDRPTSAPASSSSLSLTQLTSRNDTPSPSTSRSSLSYQQQQQQQQQQHYYTSQQDDAHSMYDGATTPTPATPVPVPASPNAPRSMGSGSFSHRMSAPGGMVGSPGLAASFDTIPSVPSNTPLDHHHQLLDHYQHQQRMEHLQQQQHQQHQQMAHSHGTAAGLLHARRERAMSLRRQSSMLGVEVSSGAHLSGSLPAGAGTSGWSLASSSSMSTTPTPMSHLGGAAVAAAQQRTSLMSSSSLYGTSPGAMGGTTNVWQGGLGTSPSYDAPHLSGSLPRSSMMGGGSNGAMTRSRLSASFLPGAAPASVPSRLSFSALGGGAAPYYGGDSDDYSEPGYEVGVGSSSFMGPGSLSANLGAVGNHTGNRLSSLSDDYDANSFHSGAGPDQLDEDDTVSAGILPASLSDLLTPIEQRRFASQRTALPASSAPGGGVSRLGLSTNTSIATGGAPTVHGFTVRPMSTASSSSETSPTNDIRKSDSAVAFDEDGVFSMQDLESALPAAAGGSGQGHTHATMTPSTSSSTVAGLGSSNATSSGQSTPWSHLHTLSALTGNGSGQNSPALPSSRRPSGPSPWGSSASTTLVPAPLSPKGLPMLCADHVRHGQCPGGCGKVHGLQCPVCGLHLLHPMAPHEDHHKHIQECLAAPLNGTGMSAADHMMRGHQQPQHNLVGQHHQRQPQQSQEWRS